MAKTILVLGASVAGLTIAHKYGMIVDSWPRSKDVANPDYRLLKTTLPGLAEEYKVVLVSPMDHAYWNVATIRGRCSNLAAEYVF
jgi:hypothetical protein